MDTTTTAPQTAAIAPKPDTLGGLSFVDKRALPRHLQQYLALQDFIDQARKVLPRPIYGYVTGGVEDNASLRGNRNVFDEIGFVPKPLVFCQSTTALPEKIMIPFSSWSAIGRCSQWTRSRLTAWPQLMCPHTSPSGLC